MSLLSKPSPALFHDAELGLRVALVHAELLAARLALSRTTTTRMTGVSDSQLARMVAASREMVAAADAVLSTAAPHLAAHAAVMANETCHRDMAAPWPPARPQTHLSLVPSAE